MLFGLCKYKFPDSSSVEPHILLALRGFASQRKPLTWLSNAQPTFPKKTLGNRKRTHIDQEPLVFSYVFWYLDSSEARHLSWLMFEARGAECQQREAGVAGGAWRKGLWEAGEINPSVWVAKQ